MSADWTTCRVVRDHDGDLWGHDSHGWNLLGEGSDSCLTTDLLSEFGPITPVLDADGLPVVTTVGDLTLRHLRAWPQIRLRVGDEVGTPYVDDYGSIYLILLTYDGLVPVTLDTPCEVLP